jgi:tetratricopeptide (TPR) repeat protein
MLSEAIRLHPKGALAVCHRGNAWFAKKEWDRAIDDFTTAIRIGGYSHLHLTYVNRGMAWVNKQDYDKAMLDFCEAKRIAPQGAEANLQRAIVFQMKGDMLSHYVDLQDGCVLERGMTNPQITAMMGLFGLPVDGPVVELTRRVVSNPFDAEAYAARSREWLTLGDRDKALYDIKEALRLSPAAREFQEHLDRCQAV